MDLRDSSGTLQVLGLSDEFGADGYAEIIDLDIGDVIGVEGTMVHGKRGELSLKASSLTLLGKAFMIPPREGPSPNQLHRRSSLQELDMIAGGASVGMLRTRIEVNRFMRRWFDDEGFLEVETPLLLPHASGAAAQPFVSKGNALAGNLFLRISIEQSLKRLVIGGFEDVYELGRCFRNEGMSRRHHFEFTMLEWLQGYRDYRQTMDLIEAVINAVAKEIFGRLRFERNGKAVDLSLPWRRITLRDVIIEKTGIDILSSNPAELARGARLSEVPPRADWAQLVTTLYSKQVEPRILEPTFVTGFPREAWPLARRPDDSPELSESFEAIIAGIEIASGATNANDPDALRQQLSDQKARNERTPEYDGPLAGLDEAFLAVVAHGMMPLTGAGMGIERVLMLLMERDSIREVIPIPTLRLMAQQSISASCRSRSLDRRSGSSR
jgi:lysyl-tRNA synthetase class 2